MSAKKAKSLPKYQSHKIVNACVIKEIVRSTDGSAVITPKEKGHKPFTVTRHYMTKHEPRTGGYYIKYKDGYESFSPADVFEEGYKKVKKAPAKPKTDKPEGNDNKPETTEAEKKAKTKAKAEAKAEKEAKAKAEADKK